MIVLFLLKKKVEQFAKLSFHLLRGILCWCSLLGTLYWFILCLTVSFLIASAWTREATRLRALLST